MFSTQQKHQKDVFQGSLILDRAKGLHKNLRIEILPLGGKRGSSSASAADWQEMLDRIQTRMVGVLERDTGWKHQKNTCDI